MDHGLTMYYSLLGATIDNEAYLNQEIDNRNQEIANLQADVQNLIDRDDWLTKKSRDLIYDMSLENNILASVLKRYPEVDIAAIRKLYADDPEWLLEHRQISNALLPDSIAETQQSKTRDHERSIE